MILTDKYCFHFRANKIIETLQSTYGHSSCYLLRINSCKDPKTESTDGVWDYLDSLYTSVNNADVHDQSGELENNINTVDASLVHPLSPQECSRSLNGELKTDSQKVYGAYLDENDYNNIRELTKHFVSRSLIPYIESQIQSLNESVFNNIFNFVSTFIILSTIFVYF